MPSSQTRSIGGGEVVLVARGDLGDDNIERCWARLEGVRPDRQKAVLPGAERTSANWTSWISEPRCSGSSSSIGSGSTRGARRWIE